MTKDMEKVLRNKISRAIGTCSKFITIRSLVWETSEVCAVRAAYKGFYYLVRLKAEKIIEILREVG